MGSAMKTETTDPTAAALKDTHGFHTPASKTSATRTPAKTWPIHMEHASRNTTKPTRATRSITAATVWKITIGTQNTKNAGNAIPVSAETGEIYWKTVKPAIFQL